MQSETQGLIMSRTQHHTRQYRMDPASPIYHNWYNKEPKWHRKLFKHRARRAEWRRVSAKIAHGADMDNIVYPMDSRPWIYYW
jgi:hypothetical protein